ncbi:MAG: hypothetical protein QM767_19880 [Anaeromyxobacter sp.]
MPSTTPWRSALAFWGREATAAPAFASRARTALLEYARGTAGAATGLLAAASA